MTTGQNDLLLMHMDQDQKSFAEVKEALVKLADKLDTCIGEVHACQKEVVEIRTEVRLKSKLNGAVWGVIAGAASSVITGLILWAITK